MTGLQQQDFNLWQACMNAGVKCSMVGAPQRACGRCRCARCGQSPPGCGRCGQCPALRACGRCRPGCARCGQSPPGCGRCVQWRHPAHHNQAGSTEEILERGPVSNAAEGEQSTSSAVGARRTTCCASAGAFGGGSMSLARVLCLMVDWHAMQCCLQPHQGQQRTSRRLRRMVRPSASLRPMVASCRGTLRG